MRRSPAFYRDLLGFEVTYSFPAEGEPQFVTLDVPGGRHRRHRVIGDFLGNIPS